MIQNEISETVPAGVGPGEDCWNRIGVWGNAEPRCPLLEQVVHCRNCGVYAAAGRRLLDRPPPPGYAEQWTAALAASPPPNLSGETVSVLVFRIGDEWLGLPTAMIREIAPMKSPRGLPHRAGQVVSGLVNVRGELLLFASLGRLFGVRKGRRHQLDDVKKTFAERLIVIERERHRFVFPVSEVDGILHFRTDSLGGVPTTIANASQSFLFGIVAAGGRRIGYLDGDAIFKALELRLS